MCKDYGLDTIEVVAAVSVTMEAGITDFGDASAAASSNSFSNRTSHRADLPFIFYQ
jgi:hypothetical protein